MGGCGGALILSGVAGPGWDDERLTEKQLRLVRASDPDAAYERTLRLGHEAEHEYTNEAGELVRWRFVGLAELLTCPKEELAVFWARANTRRTARDLLDED